MIGQVHCGHTSWQNENADQAIRPLLIIRSFLHRYHFASVIRIDISHALLFHTALSDIVYRPRGLCLKYTIAQTTLY